MHDVRPPADRDDPTRSDDGPRVHLDDGGLLRASGRWVAISDAQLPVVELLVQRFGKIVSMDKVLHAYGATGGAATPNAIRCLMRRVRERAEAVGLTVQVVRRRGFVLDHASQNP